jgi:lichenan operon transcriptional antiterminator
MEFYANLDEKIHLKAIAEKNGVSIRTIQSDIKEINDECEKLGIQIVSYGSKGSQLVAEDTEKLNDYANTITNEYNNYYYFDDQNTRVYYILNQLLSSNEPIKMETLAEQMYISKSRISSDLNMVKNILNKYDLTLVSIPYHGCTIEGREFDKRRCIVKENLANADYRAFVAFPENNSETLSEIRDIVTPILVDNQFEISDIALQNLIIHIETSIIRIKTGHVAEEEDIHLHSSYKKTYIIAQKIMEACSQKYDFPMNNNEVVLLAFNLYGKQIFDKPAYISEEMDKRITDALTTVSKFYNIDFVNDLNLRISLALHITPMEARLIVGMPLQNIMTDKIKQSYAYAFDIATAFTSIIFAKQFGRIPDDEISYVALHFMVSIERYNNQHHKVNILLICQENLTNTVLLSQRLQQWFPQIAKIQRISSSAINTDDFAHYNAVLTTDKTVSKKYQRAKLIHLFPQEEDYKIVEMAINGINGAKDIIDKFDRTLFYAGPANDKYDIIRILFEKAQKEYNLTEEYYNSVLIHEDYASSWFGNNLAVPHAEKPITNQTFIAVGVLDKPIQWDPVNTVQIVFLVSLDKTRVESNQIWYYLADIISNKEALNKIIEKPTYENLVAVLKEVYKHLS